MKNNKKILIIVIIILVLIIAILLGIFVAKNVKENSMDYSQNNNQNSNLNNNTTKEEFVKEYENGTKVNSSNKFSQAKTIEGLDIKNIQFTYTDSNKMSILIADVENNTGKSSPKLNVRVYLLDKDGNQIDYMDGIIAAIEPGEKTKLNIGILADFSNAYDFTIEKN